MTPYVGLGLGVLTEVDFDIEGGSAAGECNDTGSFAVQAIMGDDCGMSDHVCLYGELR